MQKVVLITGAGGGFGKVVAKAFHEDGYQLILVDIDKTRLYEANKRVGSDAFTFVYNIARESDVKRLFTNVSKKLGRIDLLFLGHGVSGGRTLIHKVSLEEWKFVIKNNLTGTFLCFREAVRLMTRQRSGCMISLATGNPSRKFGGSYIASKVGIEGLTAAVAAEVRENNVGVFAVSPGGYADTSFHDNSYQLMHFKSYVPDSELRKQSRPINPEVIIPFCKFVSSDNTLSMTGRTVNALDWNESNGFGPRDKWFTSEDNDPG